jgi:glutamate-1-semialdehyde 2,1-aminomutase
MEVTGHPSWSFLQVRDARGCSLWEIKTLLLQELFARGVLTLGTHNMSYAHTDEDVTRLLAAYDGALEVAASALREGDVRPYLRCAPLEPLFKVR